MVTRTARHYLDLYAGETVEQLCERLALAEREREDARDHALEEAAKTCEVEVEREAGYGGRWEGYGSFKDAMTGRECAAAVRAKKSNGGGRV